MTETLTATRISLGAHCEYPSCTLFAKPLYQQLSAGYETCSVLPLPADVDNWRDTHRTARKRADRAHRLGYRSEQIQRELFIDDIHEINTSLEYRQGRRMSAGYQERQNFVPLPSYPCAMHAIRTYGVLWGPHLFAYLWLYRSGDLALVSQILGHGDHLPNDVMYLLLQGVIGAELEHGGLLVYNRADSGTDGLRYFKSKLGFEATEVQWAP
jgi:hypothetical protein